MALADASSPVYLTAVAIGMLHGVEPGHGWPVAATLALGSRNRWAYGIGAALILAAAHLVSSFAVVAVFALANRALEFESLDWIHWVAGGLLLLMAVFQWRGGHSHHRGHAHSHGHGHEDHAHGHGAVPRDRSEGDRDSRVKSGTLLGLIGFAFALGFVHEEEFAIIALAVGKTSPWLLMATYAGAVSLSLVLLTTLAIATLNRFDAQLRRYHHHLPRVTAVVLAAMGVAYLTRMI